jgi:hypothetical protein
MANTNQFAPSIVEGVSQPIFMVALKKINFIEKVATGQYRLSVSVNDRNINKAYKVYSATILEYGS